MARDWIAHKLGWLEQEFGAERLREAPIVEPTPQFFPDPYDGTPAAAERLFHRVCGYMAVDPAIVELEVFDESNRPWFVNDRGDYLPGAAGTFEGSGERFLIRMERSELHRPMDCVGTFAHELAHLRLLGEGRSDPDAFDNELLTDLTALFFGFGTFLISSPRHWHSQLSCWPGTDVRRPEYMTLPMFAWALALVARKRGEPDPPSWLRHLGRDARAEYRAAMRFLAAAGTA